jgi:hypothetical protein
VLAQAAQEETVQQAQDQETTLKEPQAVIQLLVLLQRLAAVAVVLGALRIAVLDYQADQVVEVANQQQADLQFKLVSQQ